jgi:hypothetical protein
MTDKKRIEMRYLRDACRASPLFPQSDPVPNEPLDFIFTTPRGTLGVELTELCHSQERFRHARLGYVAPKAQKLYTKRPGARAVNVSPVLNHEAESIPVDVLAQGLAEFVYRHQNANENIEWHETDDMPDGYAQIGVFDPFEWEPGGNWRYFGAWRGHRATREMIEARILEKNARIVDYRKRASEVWLLIVNDTFLGPGEVTVRADELTQWTFDFGFDKVMLFERQPDGSGEVTELRRR